MSTRPQDPQEKEVAAVSLDPAPAVSSSATAKDGVVAIVVVPRRVWYSYILVHAGARTITRCTFLK